MVDYDFSGRTAVVTGGAKGIGLGIGRRLASSGCAVVVWDIDPEPLRTSAAADSFEAVFTVDVTEPASIDQAVQNTLAQVGRIDILVNNAGVSGPTLPSWEYPLEDWDRVIAADLTSVFLCCRAVIPVMLEQGGGRIVNVASVAGQGGQRQRVRLLGGQGGCDRADEIAGQGAGAEGDHGQLCCPGDGADRPSGRDEAGVHCRLKGEDPDGPFRHDRGQRRDGGLAVQRRLQLLDRRGVRCYGRAGDILSRRATRLVTDIC